MNILIFGANWYNHGDEAAVRAMIDELRVLYPDCHIKLQFNQHVEVIPYDDIDILDNFEQSGRRNPLKVIPYRISLISKGSINLVRTKKQFEEFVKAVKWADYAIYAPGGPSIGDHYHAYYLVDMMELLYRNKVPYSIYAPSMGPFSIYTKKIKKALDKAEVICFREGITGKYFSDLGLTHPFRITLDAAFQHRIDTKENGALLNDYKELKEFLNRYEKVVGITVTDLKWHRDYRDTDISESIKATFAPFVRDLQKKGFGVLFVPQLFGIDNDADYMSSFAGEDCFVVDEKYDCYFQQYIISKLYAVVGMRYHSNIFSAKMGVPFVSIAYEQKMSGFMKKASLEKYCIPIKELSLDLLSEKFSDLLDDYDSYSKLLKEKSEYFHDESYITTKLISDSINQLVK